MARLTHEEFTVKAVKDLRQVGRKGIHTRFSGFNAAFRDYFPDDDPVVATSALVAAGKLSGHFVRGGYMLYLAGEAPAATASGGASTLRKMGLKAA